MWAWNNTQTEFSSFKYESLLILYYYVSISGRGEIAVFDRCECILSQQAAFDLYQGFSPPTFACALPVWKGHVAQIKRTRRNAEAVTAESLG